jgi:hypothetical protein
MPLSEQTVKKLSLISLIFLAVTGSFFMLFAFFLNKGTLTVIAHAPYVINIGNIKTEACPTDECSVVMAPGKYEVTLKKAGYRDAVISVDVPIGGEKKAKVDFEFLPTLRLYGDESAMRIFADPVVAPADDLPLTGIFYEKNYLAYIDRDSETHRQTLYVRTINAGQVGEKTIATSFMREIKDYKLVTDIENRGKIALIDATAGASTLYMIDLKAKTRENLLTYPLITDIRWIPGGDDFLFSARDEGDISESLFIFHWADRKASKLNLKTTLANVVPVNASTLIAATLQNLGGDGSGNDLEGHLVTLGENEATPSVMSALVGNAATTFAGNTAPLLKFIEYSLPTDQARLLKIAPDLGYPARAALSETQKSAYFLIDGKDYELQFADEVK